MKTKFRASIRLKIMALIVAGLTLSLASYVYVGTSLIRQDKLSYVYEYNLDRVRASTSLVEAQLDRDFLLARTIGRLVAPGAVTRDEEAALKGAFDAAATGMSGLVLLRPISDQKFSLIAALGERAADTELAVAKNGWTPATLRTRERIVGPANSGYLSLAGRTLDASGAPIAYAMLVGFDSKLLATEASALQLRLVDSRGQSIYPASAEARKSPDDDLNRQLARSQFQSGAREVEVGGKPFLAAYRKLGLDQLTLIGLIPKDAAFATIRALVFRSVIIGLGIALLASGLALLFVRNLTSRIRQMWHATLRVSEGDFSVRVPTARIEDEVSGLARSFNTMAEKIDDLMAQTAQKARMEKELETAQVVQKLFFPSSDFEHASLRMAGQFVPASECSGDWWHYAALGQHLVMVVGDATGHGVSAALVTAAAHAAFNLWVESQSTAAAGRPSLESLLECLNTAVRTSAQGQVLMTCSACCIDLESGEMVAASAAHPLPVLYREADEKPENETVKPCRLISFTPSSQLGQNERLNCVVKRMQLLPGDRLFWYTDGLLEARAGDSHKISRPQLLKTLSNLSKKHRFNARQLCNDVLDMGLEFLGKNAAERPDDITVIVATIPRTANFGVSAGVEEAQRIPS